MVTRIRQHNGIAARNFTFEQAQSRLHEVVTAAQQISTNSVFVHATPIIYFSKQEAGTPCGCRSKLMNGNQTPVDSAFGSDSSSDFEIDLEAPIFRPFGSNVNETMPELADDDLDGVPVKDNMNPADLPNHGASTFDSLFGNSTACPICLRSGVVPGYQAVGHSRIVLSSVFVHDAVGYTIDSGEAVPRFVLLDKQLNYVEFDLVVPLTFKSVNFAVYDGQNVLRNALLSINGHMVSESLLMQLRGREVKLRIYGVSFTHSVFLFKINNDLKADFPQDSKPKDYSIFDATQPITVVMDKSVPKIATSDIIYKVGYNQFWKVNDFDYYRMNDKTVIGWSVQARILQKDELGHILMSF